MVDVDGRSPRDQYLYVARRLRSALEVQHDRVAAGGDDSRHDSEMYTLLLANFEALVYRAAGLRADEPEPVDPSFPNLYLRIKQRFPRLRRWRNYLGHPPFLQLEGNEHGWATFDDGVWALLDDGTAESIVDIEIDHLVVRRFVDELIVCLEVDA